MLYVASPNFRATLVSRMPYILHPADININIIPQMVIGIIENVVWNVTNSYDIIKTINIGVNLFFAMDIILFC